MRRLPAPVHLAPLKKGNFVSVAVWIGASLIVFAGVWQRFVLATGFLWFVIPAVAAAAVWWDLKGKSRAGIQSLGGMITPLLFVLSVLGAASGLYGAWRSGFVVDWFSAGPLLPFSDAGEYVNGAKSLITFGELGEISARRPLGTTLIAVALWITNQNYQLSLILLALLTGVTTFFAVRQTFLAGGLLAALLYLGLCLLVLSEWVPLFGTETTGYLFASLSYAVLLSAFRRRSFNESLIGLALLILAQAARPGAILAIPTVGGYLIYFFSTTWRGALRKAMILAALVIALLLMDRFVSIKIGPPHLEYQGNVAYSLYGLAAGDKSWTYVLAEHPEINQITSDGERSRYVYGLFWRRLIAHPEVFASVIVKRFWLTIQDLASVYFGLVKHIPLALVSILGLIGFVLLLRPAIRRSSAWAFLPVAAIGTFLSAPFLFDAGSRIYMSIVSFHLALTSIPVALGADWIRKRYLKEALPPAARNRASIGEIVFAAGITAAATVFPICISLTANPRPLSAAVHEIGLAPDEGVFYFNPHSGILIEGKNAPPGVLNVPFEALVRSGQAARELEVSSYIFRGDFLCHALLLAHPTGHEDAIATYVVFDSIPRTAPGYLIVTLRLLVQQGGTALFRAEDFRPLNL